MLMIRQMTTLHQMLDPTGVSLGDAPIALLDEDLDNVVGTTVVLNVVNNDSRLQTIDLDPATVNITTPGAADTDGDGDN